MTVKLKIDLVNGVLEAEGDDAFVRSIHSEFRSYVGEFFKPSPKKSPAIVASVECADIVGHYLQNVAGKAPFSANQIFTCYKITKERPPQAFAKALNDARSNHHFFKYETLDEISVTHFGDTHFDHDLKKKD